MTYGPALALVVLQLAWLIGCVVFKFRYERDQARAQLKYAKRSISERAFREALTEWRGEKDPDKQHYKLLMVIEALDTRLRDLEP